MVQCASSANGPRWPAEAEKVLEAGGMTSALDGESRIVLQQDALPKFLPRQRWFGAKSKTIDSVTIRDWRLLDECASWLLLLEVRYKDESADTYFVPVAFIPYGEASALAKTTPEAVLIACRFDRTAGYLCDATSSATFCRWLLKVIAEGRPLPMQTGEAYGRPGAALPEIRGPSEEDLAPVRGRAEQSNTSIRYGGRLILKLFRKVEAGPNPDCELNAYLGERSGFDAVPRFAGVFNYGAHGAPETTLGMLQEFIPNGGDGWQSTLEELGRYYEQCRTRKFPLELESMISGNFVRQAESGIPRHARELVGSSVDRAGTLARRTAEMHIRLAAESVDDAFRPEPLNAADIRRLIERFLDHASKSFETLSNSLVRLPDDTAPLAGEVLARRRFLLERFRALESVNGSILKIRVHGDYHLGQVLVVDSDFRILDFEGEPARSLAERRSKQPALKDVAGMLRSFSYAAWSALLVSTSRRSPDAVPLEPWSRLWEKVTCAVFLAVYRQTSGGSALVPEDPTVFQSVLEAFLLDKALYELSYELNNRPAWVRIPLLGIINLAVDQ